MISLLFHFSIFYQQYNYPIERNIEEPKDTNQVIQSSTEKSNIVTFLCVCVYFACIILCVDHRLSTLFSSLLYTLLLFLSLSFVFQSYTAIHDETTRDRSSNRFRGWRTFSSATRLKFSSNRVEPCLRTIFQIVVEVDRWGKCIVITHARKIYGRSGVENDGDTRERRNGRTRKGTDETNGFFGILFPGG